MLEIGVPYFGFGLPEYRVCSKYLVSSARRTNPKATLTHITDNFTPPLEGFDQTVRMQGDVPWECLMSAKGQAVAGVALESKSDRFVFTDPDVYVQKDFNEVFGDFDIAFCVRDTSPHKFYHGGLVFSTNKARPFWKEYRRMCERMTKDIGHWWVEQIAYAVLLGVDRKVGDVFEFRGVKVKLLDFYKYCGKPDDENSPVLDTYIAHFAGERKQWMGEYDKRVLQAVK